MTDFLTRLAQRTLGLVPVVQPRTASRYAPAAEIMIENQSEALASSQPLSQLSTHLSTEERGSSLPLRSSEPFSRTAPEANLNTQNSLNTNNTVPIPPPPSPLPASSEVSQNNTEPLPLFSQTTVSSLANSSENLVKSAAFLPRQNLEVQTFSPMGGLMEPQPMNPSSNLPSADVKEPSSSVSQTLPQPEQWLQISSPYIPLVPPAPANASSQPWSDGQEPSVRYPLVTLANPASPAVAPAPSSLARLSLPITQPIQKPEPDIEVRIGRIEVRGIQPTTPKARSKSRPPTPALSLNDYLNQREGGKP